MASGLKTLAVVCFATLAISACGESQIKYSDHIVKVESTADYTLAFGNKGVYLLKGEYNIADKKYKPGTAFMFAPSEVRRVDLNDIYKAQPELEVK